MRFIVEIDADGNRHVAGQVVDQDGCSAPFTGWLELVQLLERPSAQATASEEDTE